MPKNTYNIVDWFMKKLDFDISDYIDSNTKEKIKDQSSQEFFDKGMEIAIKGAETTEKADSLKKLKRNPNMEGYAFGKIIGEPKFNQNLDEFFETKLKEIVDETELPENLKNDFRKIIPTFDDKDVFRSEIKLAEKEYKKEELDERKESIGKDIDAIEDLKDLDNAKKRIKRLIKKNVDVSDLESRIEEIRIGLEIQREAEKEEKTRLTREQQGESRRRKEDQRKRGFEPNF